MKLYCVQLDIAWEAKEKNFARVRELMTKAKVEAGSLILLPEMFATGFSLNVGVTAEEAIGPTQQFLAEMAATFHVTMAGGLARTSDRGKAMNRCVVVSPRGQLLCDYAKLHPFSFGKEPQHFVAGDQVSTFKWGDFTVAPTICYDLRFPELYRRAMQQGAQLITCIANWPSTREHHWFTLLQARAIENQCFVAGCNRSGNDPHLPYNGRSLIIDPQGKVLADAGSSEGVISAELDLKTLTAWRESFPALTDIRWDLLPNKTQ